MNLKIPKTNLIFLNDDNLIKMLYLAVKNVAKKYTSSYTDHVINRRVYPFFVIPSFNIFKMVILAFFKLGYVLL